MTTAESESVGWSRGGAASRRLKVAVVLPYEIEIKQVAYGRLSAAP